MGWLLDTEPSTKTDYIRQHFTGPNASSIKPCALLDHSLGRSGLWALLKAPDDHVFIVLFLLERGDDCCWGYKDVGEECGPCEVDCPLRFLAQAPEPPNSYRSAEGHTWRERVRAHHEAKRATAKLPRLKVGQRVHLGEPFADWAHGDYTVTADHGRKGYSLGGNLRLTAAQRKHVTVVEESFAVRT